MIDPAAAIERLPPPWPIDPLATLQDDLRRRSVVVLDDDPTGTQTVRDVTVLMSWSAEALTEQLAANEGVIYLLANSRSLDEPSAVELAHRTGADLRTAVAASGREATVISRSDSTLRGHFPAESDALATGFGLDGHRTLVAPFFGAGGRLTIDDVHYLRENGRFIPVAETPFAQDAVFGYSESNLRAWIADRVGAANRAVESISLDSIRTTGPDGVRDRLREVPPLGICIINAVDERDVEVAAAGAAMSESAGLPIVARTAAAYVRARVGQPVHPLLEAARLDVAGPGLIVVGSHVQGTTEQLGRLTVSRPRSHTRMIEIDVDALVSPASDQERAISAAASSADAAAAAGRTAVVFTSRTARQGADVAESLRIAATISRSLSALVRRIERRPAWLIAKGGITSHDLAANGLDVRTARVLGQLLPGVPVWRLGPEARWPGLVYVVFPGNVGGPDALLQAKQRLEGIVA